METLVPSFKRKSNLSWSQRFFIVTALLAMLFSGTQMFVEQAARAAALAAYGPHKVTPYPGKPNRYQPTKPTASSGPYPGPAPAKMTPVDPATVKPTVHPFKPTMKELVVPLTKKGPTTATGPTVISVPASATGSDGTLEISVPQGAVSATDITTAQQAAGITAAAAVSPLSLVIDQVGGVAGSSSTADGSGIISLGTYTFQVQNAKGQEVATPLRQPLTLTYHIQGKHQPIDFALQPVLFTMGSALPINLPHALAHPSSHKATTATFDATTNTLKAIVPLGSSGGGAFTAASPVGYWGKPNVLQNDLHTGSLTDSIAIDVPAGPGGLTPPMTLNYSSEGSAGNHGAQGTAGWVGQGWTLDPGAISWSEQNIPAPSGTANWIDKWNISDSYGTSGELLPPNVTTATYYDDTPNNPSGVTTWRVNPESHAKVISYQNPTVDCTNFPNSGCAPAGGYTVQPPCFRVWLANGIMEEFGCTTDSRQWYPAGSSNTTNYVSAWKVDLITDPNGNQIHYTYASDTSHNSQNIAYPRDLVLSKVEWDAPSCHNANTACSGASWDPRMQVAFSVGHAVAHVAPGATVCTQTGFLRCDDPVAETSPAMGTPLVINTEVLNDIKVNVRTTGTGAWNVLHQYVLSYAQGAGSTIVEAYTGNTESIAGYLTLNQVQEFGTDGSGTGHLSYPPITFKYSIPSAEYYEDGQYTPSVGAGCGPAWNKGYNGTCVLWYRTYSNEFMSESDNGLGLQQTFTWQNLRTNQHGVYASAPGPDNDPSNPGACTDLQNTSSTGYNVYPCSLADDNGWSHISLKSRTQTVNDPLSSNSSNQVTGTWGYNYGLSALTAKECSDCNYGMYWGNANDGDVLDYYNGQFKGFNFAQVVYPPVTGGTALQNQYFYSTIGWGVWDNTKV
ncbi:MAG: hypothetical protein H0U76_22775, partial [Ktedonobacteraceae bacterium]|nr:hypothetical protein [Ktedonobacteraceae bacterium]